MHLKQFFLSNFQGKLSAGTIRDTKTPLFSLLTTKFSFTTNFKNKRNTHGVPFFLLTVSIANGLTDSFPGFPVVFCEKKHPMLMVLHEIESCEHVYFHHKMCQPNLVIFEWIISEQLCVLLVQYVIDGHLMFIYLFIAIFLGQLCPREKAQRGLWNPCKAPTLTGQTTITGRIPYSFRTVRWVLYRPLLLVTTNHDRADAGDGTYGLSSLSLPYYRCHNKGGTFSSVNF